MPADARPTTAEALASIAFGCAEACRARLTYTLIGEGRFADAGTAWLLERCADLAQDAGTFLMLGDPGAPTAALEACAAACDRAVSVLEERGDPNMNAVIEICRRCATACRAAAGPGLAA